MSWPDRGLLWLALAAWALAGATRIREIAAAASLGGLEALWIALFAAFGACLTVALGSRGRGALLFTIAQSAAAIGILTAGMPRFEGALLAIVGAQLGLVARPAVAWTWMVLQAIPLFAAVARRGDLEHASRAAAEYLAFAAFAMLLFGLRRREREQRLDLARINAELLATRERLAETARAAEQSRIQREMHDSLGHYLAVLSMEIDRAADGSSDGITRARAALGALRQEARAVLSAVEEPIDLRGSLASLAAATPSLQVHIDAPALAEVRPEAAWPVFRCVQEAITNAWKHGAARHVTITSEARGDRLVLRVENDGAPPPEPLVVGRGLRGMCDRAAMIGAAVTFEHRPRFSVILSIPRGSAA